jgi:nucleoid DNA-binding protein
MGDDDDDDTGNAGRKGKAGRVLPPVVAGKAARSGVQVKKKDFVDKVAAASGVKKGEVKSVLDAALAIMVERVMAGDELVLPPLGKLRLLREKDNGKARIATLRLQVAGEGEGASDPLAEAED